MPQLQSQQFEGKWQGTVEEPAKTQLSLTISQGTDSAKAVLHRRDQAQELPVEALKLAGATLTFSVRVIGATYQGTLSSDGSTIKGKWTQDGNAHPLTFSRVTPQTAWDAPATSERQSPVGVQGPLSYEVATIRPSSSNGAYKSILPRGSALYMTNTSIGDLVEYAYNVRQRQIIGLPDWAKSPHYDLVIKPDKEGSPTTEQFRNMVAKVLLDRFAIKCHPDRREFSAYDLVVGKTQPRLVRNESSERHRSFLKPIDSGGTLLVQKNATMADFTSFLMAQVIQDRPVIDKTNLAGGFDFEFSFLSQGSPPPDSGEGKSTINNLTFATDPFQGVQEQLGLKLVPSKAQLDVIVIDQAGKPSPN